MNKATFYIGIEKNGSGRQLAPDVRALGVAGIRESAARTFGGYTLTHAEGGWINDSGVLVAEGCIVLDTFTDKAQHECEAFARVAGGFLGQACVALEFRPAVRVAFVDCSPAVDAVLRQAEEVAA